MALRSSAGLSLRGTRAIKVGFDEHLTKPVDPEALTQVLTLRRQAAGTFQRERAFTG